RGCRSQAERRRAATIGIPGLIARTADSWRAAGRGDGYGEAATVARRRAGRYDRTPLREEAVVAVIDGNRATLIVSAGRREVNDCARIVAPVDCVSRSRDVVRACQ